MYYMSKNFAKANDRTKFRQILNEFIRTFLFLLCLIGGGAFFANLHLPNKKRYSFDAEKVVQWKKKPYFLTDAIYFTGGHLQSAEKAHSGTYSVKMSKGQTYALFHEHKNLTGYEQVSVFVWRYNTNGSHGKIVLTIPNNILWTSGGEIIETTPDGWERIKYVHQLTPLSKNKTLGIYIWNPSKTIVYFDDMEVEIVQKEKL